MSFRFACKNGRGQIVTGDDRLVDVAEASGGRIGSDPIDAFRRWDEVRALAATVTGGAAFDEADLDAPSPWPLQVFGIGLNYRSHAEETGMPIPTSPLTFTKFSSSVAGPRADVPVAGIPTADWEVELVVVMAAGGRDIPAAEAWDRVAGIAVGQDISDRALQYASQPPQFSLGKSRRNFSPFGPWLVDARDVPNRDALSMSCSINGEEVQQTVTSDLIFSVPEIISYLSGICQLLPGDVLFTGTPAGVGVSRDPKRFLSPGDVVVSTLEHVGSTVNRCV